MQNLKEELLRRQSTTARLLSTLKKYGEINTRELQRNFGTGCSSRLHELRVEGHEIQAVYVRPGFYRYVYKGRNTDDKTSLLTVE